MTWIRSAEMPAATRRDFMGAATATTASYRRSERHCSHSKRRFLIPPPVNPWVVDTRAAPARLAGFRARTSVR